MERNLQGFGPELSTVLDRQHFDVAVVNAVGDDVRSADDDQFADASNSAGTTPATRVPEPLNTGCNRRHDAGRCCRIVLRNASANFIQPPPGAARPADDSRHLRRLRFVYLAIVAATSASVAKSPLSASRNPASISAS